MQNLHESGTFNIQDISRHAVANAMMVAQYVQLMDDYNDTYEMFADGHLPAEAVIDRVVAYLTDGNCQMASVEAAAYLAKKYPSLFDYILLIKSTRSSGVEPKFKNTAHTHSVYFLAKDVTGIWHAGSPANHTASKKSRLETVYTDARLNLVLEMIRSNEGGLWPEYEFVENSLVHRYQTPTIFRIGNPVVPGVDIFTTTMIDRVQGNNQVTNPSFFLAMR